MCWLRTAETSDTAHKNQLSSGGPGVQVLAASIDRHSALPSEAQTFLTFDSDCLCKTFGYQRKGHAFGFPRKLLAASGIKIVNSISELSPKERQRTFGQLVILPVLNTVPLIFSPDIDIV